MINAELSLPPTDLTSMAPVRSWYSTAKSHTLKPLIIFAGKLPCSNLINIASNSFRDEQSIAWGRSKRNISRDFFVREQKVKSIYEGRLNISKEMINLYLQQISKSKLALEGRTGPSQEYHNKGTWSKCYRSFQEIDLSNATRQESKYQNP